MTDSGWGGDPWAPAGADDWTGSAYDPYTGYVPPVAGRRRGRGATRTALVLGLASVVAAVLVVVVAVAGLVTFVAGGFLLWLLIVPLTYGAIGLAAVSVAVAAFARGAGWGSRVGAAAPGLLTLLVAAPFLTSNPPVRDEEQAARDEIAITLPGDAPPEDVVSEAASARWMSDPERACLLLAAPARGEDCPDDPAFEQKVEWTGRVAVVRKNSERALVSRSEPFGGTYELLRLVREDGRWRLLDLPGVPNPCVTEGKDPFGCAVRRIGKP